MELETGNDRQNKEMVVPYLINGYCAGSWNNDDSDLTSSQEAPTQ